MPRLIQDYALAEGDPSATQLLKIAADLGLKAKRVTVSLDRLPRLGAAFPVIVRLTNGNMIVVAGLGAADGQDVVGIMDPLLNQPGIFALPLARLAEQWSGEVLLLKRVYRLGEENRPFGFGYFINELARQKSIFRDIAVAALMLQALGLATPVYFQLVIDKVLVHHSQSTLAVLAAGICLVLLFEAVFGYLRQYLSLSATSRLDVRLTTRTFSHLLALPITYFEESSAGVTARHMQQVEKIRQFLTGRLFMTALDAVALLVFLPILFLYSGLLGAIVLAFAAVIAAVVAAMIGPFRRRLQQLYNAEAERQAMLVETIAGMRTIKSLALEPQQRKSWDQRAAAAVTIHFRVGKMGISTNILTTLLEKLLTVTVIAVGAQAVFDQTLTIGALIAFNMLSNRVVNPLVQIAALAQEYQEAALSLRMLGTVMNRPPERADRGQGLRPHFSGRIEFNGVTFRYAPDAPPALDNISLTIPAGAVIGVVGRSGSGKSTLTKLIQALYAPQSGVIRLDGADIREIELAHLRRSIGVVLQDSFLFRGTIRDNIAVAKPGAALEEVVTAARLAGADEFIERLPQGYETPLEENAANLSGGQKQRLSIARALLAQPRFLIFDEATSALDPDSEAIFMTNLARIAAGRTVIIVSHRLSTLVACNAILVLDQGRIVDAGPHKDLLSRCKVYGHLWQQQNRHL